MTLSVPSEFVQTRSSGTSKQQDTAVTVSSGDLVVVCVSTYQSNGTAGTWAVTDDAGQTYSEAIDSAGLATPGCIAIFYKENHPGGTVKVTVDPNGTSSDIDFTVSVVHSTNGAFSASLDKALAEQDVTTGTPNIATGTLVQADEIIFAIITHQEANTTFTPDGTYTQIGENENNATGQCYNAQRKIVATTTSDVADWTLGASRDSQMCLASFKEPAGGAAMRPIQSMTIMQAAVSASVR